MTIKELCKKYINCTTCPYLSICGDRPENYGSGEDLEVTNAIIETAKAMEQHCEDAISRQAMLEYIEGSDAELGHSSENELVCQDIKGLPPVTPQSKTGHWIELPFSFECSECGIVRAKETSGKYNFCPNCGARMVESQEKVRDKE